MYPKSGARGLQRFAFLKYYDHWNEKVHFMAEHCQKYKLPIISKNSWNKSCAELNFLKKSQWTHISTYTKSGARVVMGKYQSFWTIEVSIVQIIRLSIYLVAYWRTISISVILSIVCEITESGNLYTVVSWQCIKKCIYFGAECCQ